MIFTKEESWMKKKKNRKRMNEKENKENILKLIDGIVSSLIKVLDSYIKSGEPEIKNDETLKQWSNPTFLKKALVNLIKELSAMKRDIKNGMVDPNDIKIGLKKIKQFLDTVNNTLN